MERGERKEENEYGKGRGRGHEYMYEQGVRLGIIDIDGQNLSIRWIELVRYVERCICHNMYRWLYDEVLVLLGLRGGEFIAFSELWCFL